MIGKAIGSGFAGARDFIAGRLVGLGVPPDALTLAGTALTCLAGVCFALSGAGRFAWNLSPGAPDNAWLPLGGAMLVLSSACDMLDGAVARIGDKKTRFGAFLDSTLDRVSDFVVYAGLAVAYAWKSPANVTFVLLCMLAFCNAFMISYTKARAEDFIKSCKVGYWQRGERSAGILIGAFACNMPAMLLQQAILPMFTVMRRITYTKAVIDGKVLTRPEDGGLLLKLRLWRWPRMTIPYDVITAANIAWLIFAHVPPWDVLRLWFAS